MPTGKGLASLVMILFLAASVLAEGDFNPEESKCLDNCYSSFNAKMNGGASYEKSIASYNSCKAGCVGGMYVAPTTSTTMKSVIAPLPPTTTLSESGAAQPNCPNPDGNCDTSKGEKCTNCPRDCECYDLQCQLGNPGATSFGCFNPCLDIDNSFYETSSGLCKCRDGYEWNQEHTNCESLTCPDNMYQDGFMCFCDEGYADCNGRREDGCEIRIRDDPIHCGSCTAHCVADSSCVEGNCRCDEGYELDQKKNQCVFAKCNKNKECEPSLNEDCNGCEDCKCKVTDVCDAPLNLHPDVTGEKGCRDCVGYCKTVFGEHGGISNIVGNQAACVCGCEPGYMLDEAGTECVAEEKSAVIFVSDKLNAYEILWIGYKINAIKNYYEGSGYKVIIKGVDSAQDIAEELVNHPTVDAMALFSHGMGPGTGQTDTTVDPTIEYSSPQELVSLGINAQREQYVKMGIDRDTATKMAEEKFKNNSFGLNSAYLNVCYGLNNNKLANSLLRENGTAWGGSGKVNPLQTLTQYTKTGAQQ